MTKECMKAYSEGFEDGYKKGIDRIIGEIQDEINKVLKEPSLDDFDAGVDAAYQTIQRMINEYKKGGSNEG